MVSPQALSEAERRLVAAWAAECAERVLPIVEAEVPGEDRPRDAVERARAFSRGELTAAQEIKRRFVALAAARSTRTPAGAAAARAAGQAAAVAHMGAHALGAAAYAVRAVALSSGEAAAARELAWQVGRASPEVRAALAQLPPVGEDSSGPLGPGLLSSGAIGEIVRKLQASL